MPYRLVVDDFNQDGVDDIFAGSQGLLEAPSDRGKNQRHGSAYFVVI